MKREICTLVAHFDQGHRYNLRVEGEGERRERGDIKWGYLRLTGA